MNYLAHAYLSPDDPLVLMGNLWGDLLKPRDAAGLPDRVQAGIERHRRIDAFTDAHPLVGEIRDRLRPHQGKYTPVVADVLLDFVLSQHWSRHHPESLEAFCQARYRDVEEHLFVLPDRLHHRVGRMLGNRWLESCKDRERMEVTLAMLSRRASFANVMDQALVPYDRHRMEIHELFEEFFADLKAVITLRSEG